MLPTNLTHPLQRKRLPQLRNKNHQNVDLTPDLNLIEEKTNQNLEIKLILYNRFNLIT